MGNGKIQTLFKDAVLSTGSKSGPGSFGGPHSVGPERTSSPNGVPEVQFDSIAASPKPTAAPGEDLIFLKK